MCQTLSRTDILKKLVGYRFIKNIFNFLFIKSCIYFTYRIDLTIRRSDINIELFNNKNFDIFFRIGCKKNNIDKNNNKTNAKPINDTCGISQFTRITMNILNVYLFGRGLFFSCCVTGSFSRRKNASDSCSINRNQIVVIVFRLIWNAKWNSVWFQISLKMVNTV